MAVNSKPTQDFVPIQEVRDGIITLKDGSLRALVMASSINFSLKSGDEQTSIIYNFQSFLNSLDFDTQIFIESKKLDIRPYIALLDQQYKNQINDLMKVQIREYINFIKNYTENAEIMTKSFFVVVPYGAPLINTSSGLPFFKKTAADTNKSFEESRAQLEQRIGVIRQGLSRCGVRSVVLGTEEVVEMFYKLFNPGDTEKPLKIGQ